MIKEYPVFLREVLFLLTSRSSDAYFVLAVIHAIIAVSGRALPLILLIYKKCT